ncbi:hypothetical protein [Clostridium tertium]|uniref:hypothetical protein n=1 Tax=Clostridium tertium TaxID=1559 RepID=UPI0024B3AA8B|nr:hypothetical protein [Clostridium tertium]MDI9215962.1 hypothetical protein [Clostridium tertium]
MYKFLDNLKTKFSKYFKSKFKNKFNFGNFILCIIFSTIIFFILRKTPLIPNDFLYNLLSVPLMLLFIYIFDFTEKIEKLLLNILIPILLIITSIFLILFLVITSSKWLYSFTSSSIVNIDASNKEYFFLIFTSIFTSIFGLLGTLIGTYISGKKSADLVKMEFIHNKNDKLEELEKNKEFSLKIIKKLLSQELNNNFNFLNRCNLFASLKNKNYNHSLSKPFKDGLEFNVYDNVKFELIKYPTNDELIENILKVYGLLQELTKYDRVKDIIDKEYNKFIKLEYLITNIITTIDSIKN